MLYGKNRAIPVYESFIPLNNMDKLKPCVFLSHINLDKEIVKSIGDYIMKMGIDIYLDIYDNELQNAVNNNDDFSITLCVERGIKSSTHILCLLSDNTINSWWVPYELGYAKRSGKRLAVLPLKALTIKAPSYINITHFLSGINALRDYLKNLHEGYYYTSAEVWKPLSDDHVSPLKEFLNE